MKSHCEHQDCQRKVVGRAKKTNAAALDITDVSRSALTKVEQYKQLQKGMQEEILRLKLIIDDLSFLFNIGTIDERKELQSKISKLEWVVYQLQQCC